MTSSNISLSGSFVLLILLLWTFSSFSDPLQHSEHVVLALRPSPSVIANIPVGKFPISLSVNPLTNVAYVANYGNKTLSVIDGKTNSVITNIKVGGNPGAISVNPATNLIYVAIAPSKTVAVIGGKTNDVITNITVGGYPLAVSINPSTNMIYVAVRIPNSSTGTISVFLFM